MVHHISHKIGVMYLGNMVELGSSDDVYKKPLHPYTRALISAAPIADPKMAKEKKRIILEGEVPSPINPPKDVRLREDVSTQPRNVSPKTGHIYV